MPVSPGKLSPTETSRQWRRWLIDSMWTDYSDWQSSLTPELVFNSGEQLRYPHFLADGVVYLTTLSETIEGRAANRTVLMFRRGDQSQCLTPEPFSLRTRISEYGGKPFWLCGDVLIFANDGDQCLYTQRLGVFSADETAQQSQALINCDRPRALTSANPAVKRMFSDITPIGNELFVAIMESEYLNDASANQSSIVLLDVQRVGEDPQVLIQGADFYSNLCVDSDANRLAWVQWQHPNMPWDETHLCYTTFQRQTQARNLELGRTRVQQWQQPASICQLMFCDRGRLIFSADFDNAGDTEVGRDFWNLWMLDTVAENSEPRQISALDVEFGYPHWQYGDVRIARLDADRVITIGSRPEGDQLYVLDLADWKLQPLGDPEQVHYQDVCGDGQGRVLVMRAAADAPPSIDLLRIGKANELYAKTFYASPTLLPMADISVAEHRRFATRDGQHTWGFYYAPRNQNYSVDDTVSPPPLLVMVHGGPTARAYGSFDLQKQFWTQHGFAVLDVNHRGSSGYGRHYRDALAGRWGEIDASDIVDSINGLIQSGSADPRQIFVRGKSAGGYAVLRVLTEYPEVFRAGACYYGIGNLATLAEITHKFEQHYTDRLIGEHYDASRANNPDSRFYQRSPIHSLHKLASAMIVFQGGADKVVPPALAHEIIKVLEQRRIEHSYVEYPEEGHGFRVAANNIDAWHRELAFYRRAMQGTNA